METKKFFSTIFILLAVSVQGVMLNDGVHEEGREGNSAVIRCSYAEQYKTSPKYFCKKNHEHCETLLKTDGQNDWKLEGRLTLFDNKEKNVFVVNIGNLSVQDAGRYGCGVETTGQDLITVVHLTVMKERTVSEATYRSGSVTASTGSSTQPTASQSLSDFTGIFYYIGGAFGAVLLVLSVTFCVFKCRVIQSSAGTTWPNSVEDMKDVCVYEDIQQSNPAEEEASETPDIMFSPNSYSACKSIYAKLTKPKQVSCSIRLDTDPNENLTEPKYYMFEEFPDAGDFSHSRGYNDTYSTVPRAINNSSPVYSVIVFSKTAISSDYTNVVPPKHDDKIST
ncbi:uncharacterized protein LOC131347019 isoform X1 [Hemibagrus wyckioides]|uniref:uncharacterized protein LOC131347019 isoform X1 n=1 Tax=Hemibagrus wyckioides TaxID=337641 RepID=UPI00266C539E|nr:uncharacterized protein LOC131347019 isoform X1 [Hemibagrus wyckioides]